MTYVIYGKIIIDDIHLERGDAGRGLLGGGGPQAAFGARLWSHGVGLLTRSGDDLEPDQVETLLGLDVDLAGWHRFPDIPTPRSRMTYDQDEYLAGGGLITSQDAWFHLLDQPSPLPPGYREPRVIHLITEFPEEPMIETARELRARGALFSLEPLIVPPSGMPRDEMLALLKDVDVVTPDWPTASDLAGSEEPRAVLSFWSTLGPEMIAVRHGARGSYVWDRVQDRAWHIPAVPTEVVDPTGAGNAFGGALCVGWAETRDARLAGSYGAISAAFLLRTLGVPQMSSDLVDEARALLESTVGAALPL